MKKLCHTLLSAPVLLAALFVTLKLTGVISWPWLVITAPLWVGWVLGLTLLVVYFLGLLTYVLAVGIIWLGAILVAKLRSL